jgi:hypothetical protein
MPTLNLALLDAGNPAKAVAYAQHGPYSVVTPVDCASLAALRAFSDRIDSAFTSNNLRPTKNELEKFSHDLYEFLIGANLDPVYQKILNPQVSTTGEAKRIQLLSNHPPIASIPWEYLAKPPDPPGPRALSTLARIVPTMTIPPHEPLKLKSGRKLRIFVAGADPLDQAVTGWEGVAGALDNVFTKQWGDLVHYKIERSVNLAALNEWLKDGYDVLHFHGHGKVGADGVGNLVFNDPKTGDSDEVPPWRLASVVADRGISLVILSACYTSKGDFTKPFNVIAEALVRTGIRAVVANQYAFPVGTAASFLKSVYRKLMETGDIDLAVAEGRVTLANDIKQQDAVPLEWGIPTLYRHADTAQLFKV